MAFLIFRGALSGCQGTLKKILKIISPTGPFILLSRVVSCKGALSGLLSGGLRML